MRTELIGCKIVKVREMTAGEQEAEGWPDPATVVELDNGSILYGLSANKDLNRGLLGYIDKDRVAWVI